MATSTNSLDSEEGMESGKTILKTARQKSLEEIEAYISSLNIMMFQLRKLRQNERCCSRNFTLVRKHINSIMRDLEICHSTPMVNLPPLSSFLISELPRRYILLLQTPMTMLCTPLTRGDKTIIYKNQPSKKRPRINDPTPIDERFDTF